MDYIQPDVEELRRIYLEAPVASLSDPRSLTDKAIETVEFGTMIAAMVACAVAAEAKSDEILESERPRLRNVVNSKKWGEAYSFMKGAQTALEKALGAMLPVEFNDSRRHNEALALRNRLCRKEGEKSK
jgi:hypothetical protein